jgi:hypothetical protein
MQLLKKRDVLGLVDLSADQLREWTNRRALIPADVKPKGRGSPGRYSWRTVLLLRIAVVLKVDFQMELQAHRDLFAAIRENLADLSFPALWGMALALHGMRRCEVIDPRAPVFFDGDVLVIHLDPHLEVLSVGFGISAPMPQLPLFPALDVS